MSIKEMHSEFFNGSELNELGISFLANQLIQKKQLSTEWQHYLAENKDKLKEIESLRDFFLEEKLVSQSNKSYKVVFIAAAVLILSFSFFLFPDSNNTFLPHQPFEDIMNEQFRDAGSELIRPGEIVGTDQNQLTIEWSTVKHGPYIIKVFNNKGQELESILTDDLIYSLNAASFQNGLYYLKIETEMDELIFSKFNFRR